MLTNTTITHLFQSTVSKCSPFHLNIVVKPKYTVEIHCKLCCYWTLLIKYLSSRYVNALSRAWRETFMLTNTTITHLFQSPLSKCSPFHLNIVVKPKYTVEIHCKLCCYWTLLIKYLSSRYVNALSRAWRQTFMLTNTTITHLFQSPFSKCSPFHLNIVVKPKYTVEIHCKLCCYWTLPIKYLSSRYVNALSRAWRQTFMLTKTTITHLFQSLFS